MQTKQSVAFALCHLRGGYGMTKHNVRKLLGVALTAAMLVSIVPAAEPLNAAGKTKLKTKNITLYKGRTKKNSFEK